LVSIFCVFLLTSTTPTLPIFVLAAAQSNEGGIEKYIVGIGHYQR